MRQLGAFTTPLKEGALCAVFCRTADATRPKGGRVQWLLAGQPWKQEPSAPISVAVYVPRGMRQPLIDMFPKIGICLRQIDGPKYL